jgi:hypothetical protein
MADIETPESLAAVYKLRLVIKQAFDIYDTDGNGALDPDELRELLNEICVLTG